MRFFLMTTLLLSSPLIFAQELVSDGDDKEMAAIINKLEKKEEPTQFSNDFKPDGDLQTDANAAANAYYKALMEDDFATAYGLMSNKYREVISYRNYLKKDRLDFKIVNITKLEFKDDLCARVRGTFEGNANAQIGRLKLPIKLWLIKEEGGWHVFNNPYNVMGITLPKGADIKLPCEF